MGRVRDLDEMFPFPREQNFFPLSCVNKLKARKRISSRIETDLAATPNLQLGGYIIAFTPPGDVRFFKSGYRYHNKAKFVTCHPKF